MVGGIKVFVLHYKINQEIHPGKKWNHDSVYIIRFNLDGKIVKMRVYIDTAHTNDLVEEHKKTEGS